jgi:hypothetical protein
MPKSTRPISSLPSPLVDGATRSLPTLFSLPQPTSRNDRWRGVLASHPPALPPPQLTAPTIRSLLPDTGRPGDGVTADRRPVLLGTAPSRSVVELFRNTEWIGRTTVAADGSWRFTPAKPLADGAYTFTAKATKASFTPSLFSGGFVVQVDTTPPAVPLLSLTLSSDTGPIGDGKTQLRRVVLKGTTEAGASVALQGQTRQARAASDGSFTFWDVPLKPGVNAFRVKVTDRAGNTTTCSFRISRLPQAEPAPDPVLTWHQTLLEAIRVDQLAPTTATRAMAMESLAVLDTLAAIDGTPGYQVRLPAPSGINPGLAAAAAAHQVLRHLFPSQSTTFDAKLALHLATLPSGPARDQAVIFGKAVGDAVIALRSTDGWDAIASYPGSSDAGQWRPTPPAFQPAAFPQWPSLVPFSLHSGSQFRPKGPPALSSPSYAAALEEVKSLGSATSTTRTAEQTQIANFWVDGSGTYTPPGHWGDITLDLALADGYAQASAARLLAVLNVALADSAIASWDAKYAEGFWRPITAIAQAGADGNPATTAQADWRPLLPTPNHPEYVSGHSTFSAAAASVLTDLLGPRAWTTDSPALPGVNRSFPSFWAAAKEAGRSRIFGGIHFEFSNQDGQTLGRQVGQWALNTFQSFENHPLLASSNDSFMPAMHGNASPLNLV